jgi:hypothetical protein
MKINRIERITGRKTEDLIHERVLDEYGAQAWHHIMLKMHGKVLNHNNLYQLSLIHFCVVRNRFSFLKLY